MKRVTLKKVNMSYEMTEEMKTLRTNIQFAGVDKKILMATSCLAGEGKSTTTYRMALTLAELGKKVLVIDADMRKSVMVKIVDNGVVDYGLSHFLSGQCKLSDCVFSTNVKGLHVIFAGPVPPNPTELLDSNKFEEMVNAMSTVYDYVLIDAAPLGLVVDAAIIAKYCDGSIMVVTANNVKYRYAQEVKEKLEATGCPILGVVLNKVDRSKSSKYYGKYEKKYYGK